MKKLILIPLLVLSLVFASTSVFAAFSCGFESPASGRSLGNNSIINISFVPDGINTSGINISVYLTSATSRNSSATINGTIISNLSNRTLTMAVNRINLSFSDTYNFDERNNYVLDCTCFNSTTNATDTTANCNSTRTSILVDRLKPNTPTAITFTNPLIDANTITATIDSATASSCFVRFGSPNVEPRAMTLVSRTACTFTVGKNSPPNNDYQTFIEANDGTNITLSAVQSVTIRAVTSDGGGLFGGTLITTGADVSGQSAIGGAQQNPFLPKKSDKAMLGIVLIVIAYLYIKNKKG